MFSMRIKLYEVELNNLVENTFVYVMLDDHSIHKAHFIDNEYHAEDGTILKPKYWIAGEINTLINWGKETESPVSEETNHFSPEQPSVVL